VCRIHITDILWSYSPWDGSPSRAEELEKLNDIHSNPRYFDVDRRREALRRWRGDSMRDSWRARKWVVSHFDNLKVLTVDTTNLMCPSGCCRLEMMRQLFLYSHLDPPRGSVDVRVLGVRERGEWDFVRAWRYRCVTRSEQVSAKLTAPGVWCATCSSFGD